MRWGLLFIFYLCFLMNLSVNLFSTWHLVDLYKLDGDNDMTLATATQELFGQDEQETFTSFIEVLEKVKKIYDHKYIDRFDSSFEQTIKAFNKFFREAYELIRCEHLSISDVRAALDLSEQDCADIYASLASSEMPSSHNGSPKMGVLCHRSERLSPLVFCQRAKEKYEMINEVVSGEL